MTPELEPSVKPCFFDLDIAELTAQLADWGEPEFRAKQLWNQVYQNMNFDPTAFSNIPKTLRERIIQTFDFNPVSEIKKVEAANGQTDKYLLGLADGKKIEAVLMRYRERSTTCISTQVGCAMNCAFCATGQMGFTRNLTSGEIAGQVFYFADALKRENRKLTNLVLMGMGEPFHNYANVIKAIDLINHKDGFNFGERRITISTVGILPVIERFTKAKRQINLAVSLHAPTNAVRNQIIPANKKYPIEDLIEVCKDYTKFTGRRITFEYAMIAGLNDSLEQAGQLSKLLKGMLCHVNLIALNPTGKYDGKGSIREVVNDFYTTLDRAGIAASIRLNRGVDIGAGCGQLLTRS